MKKFLMLLVLTVCMFISFKEQKTQAYKEWCETSVGVIPCSEVDRPVITLSDDFPTYLQYSNPEPIWEDLATAQDSQQDLTNDIVITEDVDMHQTGYYEITYTVTNYMVTTTVTRQVMVII